VKRLILLVLTCVVGSAASGDLADGAKRHEWAKVRTLLAKSSKDDVRFAQADGMTALHWAVESDEADMVVRLLAAGADANAPNRLGVTPLWLAGTNGSVAVTRALLKAGADAKATLPHGETALMTAARTGRAEVVRMLLAAGADPNARESAQGETALMWAAAENQGDAIRALMAGDADASVHTKALKLAPMDWMQVGMVSTVLPVGGWTALMIAARQDAQDAVRALTERPKEQGGADPDEQDADGATALQIAIINQHFDLAAVLLERRANPNVADVTGMSALYAAIDMIGFRSEIGRPAKNLMDKLAAIDIVRLCLQHGANPNLQLKKAILGRHHGFGDNTLGAGATALMRATKAVDLEVMQMLVDAGADPKLGMANGSNAVQMIVAARPGPGPAAATDAADRPTTALRLLAKHGADLNAANQRGDRPLHIAAQNGSNAMVKALLELGADINATNRAGKTALEIVSEPGRNQHADTAAILREAGAKSK
jgi:uncharacterized protein